jgi:hypothetical protein
VSEGIDILVDFEMFVLFCGGSKKVYFKAGCKLVVPYSAPSVAVVVLFLLSGDLAGICLFDVC